MQRVVRFYAEQLRNGTNTLPFVPVISGGPQCDTMCIRVVVVEVDGAALAVVARFRNFTVDVIDGVLHDLPDVLQSQWTRVDPYSIRVPVALLDSLLEELSGAACGGDRSFFVSGPSPQVLRSVSTPYWDTSRIELALPPPLSRVVRKHQLDGVTRMVGLRGRVLLADDMGVGKTLQALGTVSVLKAYPLLVLCPSVIKLMWAEEVEKYLHADVPLSSVHVVHGSNTALPVGETPKVVIVSYHMAAIIADQLTAREWKCLICDESHLLHTNMNGEDAQYTRVAVEIGRNTPHCLLLSGTPALASPFDLYNQVDMLCPGLLGVSRWAFALRYCRLRFTPYLHINECVRPTEFSALLRCTCMIRRLKKDVIDLPAKRRVILRVVERGCIASHGQTFQEEYSNCWKRKLDGIKAAVAHCCGKYAQVVLFAHHIELLDILHSFLSHKRITHIQIDGRVHPQARGALLAKFDEGAARAALIGITSCAIGISLASAQCAVFCELPPDAVWMSQAEDRLHRPGLRTEVTVYYVVGVHSPFDTKHLTHLHQSYEGVCHLADDENTTLDLLHVVHSTPPREARKTTATTLRPYPSDAVSTPLDDLLMFRVSKNTGRVHVRGAQSSFYTSYSREEACECVRARRGPVWKGLEMYLASLDQHSPYERRQIVASESWLPHSFRWQSQMVVFGKRNRYRATMRCGWVFWWGVKRTYFASGYYYGSLRVCASGFYPVCLNCGKPTGTAGTFFPGAVVSTSGDLALFCTGKCREQFFLTRSGAAIRRSVQAADRGICARCHVDCEELCTVMAAHPALKDRERIVKTYHPQLLQFPTLYKSFLHNPSPGNCWHADHIVPVACGGGEAPLANLQTLCVACHALKTQEDMRCIKKEPCAVSTAYGTHDRKTTVDVACGVFLEERKRRVTRKQR